MVSKKDETWQWHMSEELTDDGNVLAVLELVIPIKGWDTDVLVVEVDRPIIGSQRGWFLVDDFTTKGGELHLPLRREVVMENEPFPNNLIETLAPLELPMAVKILAVAHTNNG